MWCLDEIGWNWVEIGMKRKKSKNSGIFNRPVCQVTELNVGWSSLVFDRTQCLAELSVLDRAQYLAELSVLDRAQYLTELSTWPSIV